MNTTSSDSPHTSFLGGDPIARLHHPSTWWLLFLACITAGVYYGHYALRQTRTLAPFLPDETARPLLASATGVLIMAYVSLIPTLALLLLPLNDRTADALDTFGGILSLIWVLMHSIWSIRFGGHMNAYYGYPRASADWFHGFWSFLLSSLYINYKLNRNVERHPR